MILYWCKFFLNARLSLKCLTPVFTICYYLLLEEYNTSDFKVEGFIIYFIELVVFWHFFSWLVRSCFEIDRKTYCSIWPLFIFIVCVFIAKIVYFFVYTQSIDRTNNFLKNFFCFLYAFLQIVNGTSLGEMSQDFWYFITDAIILSQICSIYLMD